LWLLIVAAIETAKASAGDAAIKNGWQTMQGKRTSTQQFP
jgi:hypothetical protein